MITSPMDCSVFPIRRGVREAGRREEVKNAGVAILGPKTNLRMLKRGGDSTSADLFLGGGIDCVGLRGTWGAVLAATPPFISHFRT